MVATYVYKPIHDTYIHAPIHDAYIHDIYTNVHTYVHVLMWEPYTSHVFLDTNASHTHRAKSVIFIKVQPFKKNLLKCNTLKNISNSWQFVPS